MNMSSAAGEKRLGQLLLQGWKMLADTCDKPSCYLPLMQSKDGNVGCCALISLPFTRKPNVSVLCVSRCCAWAVTGRKAALQQHPNLQHLLSPAAML